MRFIVYDWGMEQPDYDFEDFRDFMKVAMGSVIQRQGIQMASEGHFQSLVTNASGVAREAARALRRERSLHIEPPKPVKAVKA